VNIVALLSDEQKGQQASFQLKKIEYIVQKKIQESRKLKHDGAHSRGFEVGLV
jgi:hypothetical protein